MNIEIKKMSLSDIPYVYEEEIKIFGQSLGEQSLYKDIMYNDMSLYFIACVDTERAGYVGSWLTIPNAEILNLFVSEEFRGLKIGKKLMNEVIKICIKKKIEMLTLEVNVNNKYAIKMYEDIGFKVSHIRKKYYDNKEDALLMILKIGG
jgi:ribosomal-protein-alanine N-acetyltransferase